MIEYFIEHDGINPELEGYEAWLWEVAKEHGINISAIAYILTTDDRLLELNRTYLEHDYYTDVLTFDLGEGADLSGDIFISLDRVNENAKELDIAFDAELRRVMVHGLLHLLGFKDGSAEEQETMRNLEDKALAMFHVKQ